MTKKKNKRWFKKGDLVMFVGETEEIGLFTTEEARRLILGPLTVEDASENLCDDIATQIVHIEGFHHIFMNHHFLRVADKPPPLPDEPKPTPVWEGPRKCP